MARLKCVVNDTTVFIPLNEGIHFHYDIASPNTTGTSGPITTPMDSIKLFSVNQENKVVLQDAFNSLKPLFVREPDEKLSMTLGYVSDDSDVEDMGYLFESTETNYPIYLRYEMAIQDGILSYQLSIYIRNEV